METESKRWKLGDDVSADDNILDGFTFRDLILAVHCNCENITPESVLGGLVNHLKRRQRLHSRQRSPCGTGGGKA